MIATEEQIEVPVVVTSLDRIQKWVDAHQDADISRIEASNYGTCSISLQTVETLARIFAGQEAERSTTSGYEHFSIKAGGILFTACRALANTPRSVEKVTL